jgi:hypothetical protein
MESCRGSLRKSKVTPAATEFKTHLSSVITSQFLANFNNLAPTLILDAIDWPGKEFNTKSYL